MEIKIGTAGTAGRTVTEKDTALAVKSGSLQVLATPVLSALMEEAAVAALAPCLPEGWDELQFRFFWHGKLFEACVGQAGACAVTPVQQ